MYRLPKTIAEPWIKALRSGEYKQCDHILCALEEVGYTYCPIAVCGKLLGISEGAMRDGDYISKEMNPNVPEELDGQTALANHLSNLNDNEGYTFEQIADYLETLELY